MSDTTITVRFSFTREERRAIAAAIDGRRRPEPGTPEATPAELLAWCSLVVRSALMDLAPDQGAQLELGEHPSDRPAPAAGSIDTALRRRRRFE